MPGLKQERSLNRKRMTSLSAGGDAEGGGKGYLLSRQKDRVVKSEGIELGMRRLAGQEREEEAASMDLKKKMEGK